MNTDPGRLCQLLTRLRTRLTSHLAHEESEALPLLATIMSHGEVGQINRAICGGRLADGQRLRSRGRSLALPPSSAPGCWASCPHRAACSAGRFAAALHPLHPQALKTARSAAAA